PPPPGGGRGRPRGDAARPGPPPPPPPPRRRSAALKPAECPSSPPDNVVVGSVMPLRPSHREDSPFIRSLPTATITPVGRRKESPWPIFGSATESLSARRRPHRPLVRAPLMAVQQQRKAGR